MDLPITVRVVDLQALERDPTDAALHTLFDVAADFTAAIRSADSPSRCIQLRERLKAAVTIFTKLQDDAADQHEAITRRLS